MTRTLHPGQAATRRERTRRGDVARLAGTVLRGILALAILAVVLDLAARSGSPVVFVPAFLAAVLFAGSLRHLSTSGGTTAADRDG